MPSDYFAVKTCPVDLESDIGLALDDRGILQDHLDSWTSAFRCMNEMAIYLVVLALDVACSLRTFTVRRRMIFDVVLG